MMSTRHLTLLFLIVSGCAHTLPRLPSRGGPRWVEHSTPHFVLWTDLSADDASKVLSRLEGFRGAVTNLVAGAAPPTGWVIALRDWDDWETLGGRGIGGMTLNDSANPTGRPVFFFTAAKESFFLGKSFPLDRDVIIQHEFSHLLLHALIPGAPKWLHEGLASLFETARYDPKTGEWEIGHLPARLGERIRRQGLDHLDCILSLKCYGSTSFYTSSLLLVSYLLNERPELFRSYLLGLRDVSRKQRARFHEQLLVGENAPPLLETAIIRWLNGGRTTIVKIQGGPESGPIARRELGDVDVLVVRALLFLKLGTKERIDSARRCAEAAVAADPNNARAWMLVAATAPDRRADARRRACALDGELCGEVE